MIILLIFFQIKWIFNFPNNIMDSSNNLSANSSSTIISKNKLIPTLSNSSINFKLLRNDVLYEFEKILTIAGGIYINNKSIVFDIDVLPSINLLVETSRFKKWGVTSFHYSNELILNTTTVRCIKSNIKTYSNVKR